MIPYDEAIAALTSWKTASTPLFMHWTFSGVSGWCAGVLKHASPAELHFGIDSVDGADFLFVINVHQTYNPQFRFVDNRESFQFFAPQRDPSQFGKVMEIKLSGSQTGASSRIILAEVFSKVAIGTLKV